MRGDEQEQPPSRDEDVEEVGEGTGVVADVLEHVQADDGVEAAGHVLGRPRDDGHVPPAAEAAPEHRDELGVGLERNDLPAGSRQLGERPDPGTRVKHAPAQIRRAAVEQPAVVAGRFRHPPEGLRLDLGEARLGQMRER